MTFPRLPSRPRPEPEPKPPPGSLQNYRVNFDKLLNRTGFRARYTLRDGVEEIRKAFDERLITDYTDLGYTDQRYLKAVGSPGHKAEEDVLVMAAFSNQRQNQPTVATAKAASA